MKRSHIDRKLRKHSDIRKLYTSSSVSVAGARLFYRSNGMNMLRTLITPVRKYGNAVQRNYVKRVGREILRQNTQNCSVGYDLAIIFYPGNYSFTDRHAQLRALLQQTPVYRASSIVGPIQAV